MQSLYAVAVAGQLLDDAVFSTLEDAARRAGQWVDATGVACLILRFYRHQTAVNLFDGTFVDTWDYGSVRLP